MSVQQQPPLLSPELVKNLLEQVGIIIPQQEEGEGDNRGNGKEDRPDSAAATEEDQSQGHDDRNNNEKQQQQQKYYVDLLQTNYERISKQKYYYKNRPHNQRYNIMLLTSALLMTCVQYELIHYPQETNNNKRKNHHHQTSNTNLAEAERQRSQYLLTDVLRAVLVRSSLQQQWNEDGNNAVVDGNNAVNDDWTVQDILQQQMSILAPGPIRSKLLDMYISMHPVAQRYYDFCQLYKLVDLSELYLQDGQNKNKMTTPTKQSQLQEEKETTKNNNAMTASLSTKKQEEATGTATTATSNAKSALQSVWKLLTNPEKDQEAEVKENPTNDSEIVVGVGRKDDKEQQVQKKKEPPPNTFIMKKDWNVQFDTIWNLALYCRRHVIVKSNHDDALLASATVIAFMQQLAPIPTEDEIIEEEASSLSSHNNSNKEQEEEGAQQQQEHPAVAQEEEGKEKEKESEPEAKKSKAGEEGKEKEGKEESEPEAKKSKTVSKTDQVVEDILDLVNRLRRQRRHNTTAADVANFQTISINEFRADIVMFAKFCKPLVVADDDKHHDAENNTDPQELQDLIQYRPITGQSFLKEFLGPKMCRRIAYFVPSILSVLTSSASSSSVSVSTAAPTTSTTTTAKKKTTTTIGSKLVLSSPYIDEYQLSVNNIGNYLFSHKYYDGKTTEKVLRGQQAAQAVSHTVVRSVTPTTITEGMELNEWAVSLTFIEEVKPSNRLHGLFGECSGVGWSDIIVPIINKSLLRLSQEHVAEKTTRKAPVSVHNTEGRVQVHGELTPDKQLCKAVVALYYHALEAILFCEKDRGAAINVLVQNEAFHRAILACSCSCVTKALGCTQKLNPAPYLRNMHIQSILPVADSSPFEFLKVSETFLRSLSVHSKANGQLGSPLIFVLPRVLQKDLEQVEVNVLDSLVWAHRAATSTAESIVEKILAIQEKRFWPPEPLAPTMADEVLDLGNVPGFAAAPRSMPPDHEDYVDYHYVEYVLRKVLKLAHVRIVSICEHLGVPSNHPIVSQIWVTFRYLIRNRIDYLYERHVDHWILCAIYGVGRTVKYQPDLKFTTIIDAYVDVRQHELGSETCEWIVKHVKIKSGPEECEGTVITLYNKIFVPTIREYLQNSKSIKKCTEQVAKLQSGEALATSDPTTLEGGIRLQYRDDVVKPEAMTEAQLRFGSADARAIEQASVMASGSGKDYIAGAENF